MACRLLSSGVLGLLLMLPAIFPRSLLATDPGTIVRDAATFDLGGGRSSAGTIVADLSLGGIVGFAKGGALTNGYGFLPQLGTNFLPGLILLEDGPDFRVGLPDLFAAVMTGDNLKFSLKDNSNPTLLTASVSNDQLLLHLATNQNGSASLTLKASGSGKSAELSFVAVVLPVNDAPTAQALQVASYGGEPVPVTLKGSDPDDIALAFELTSPPQHGALSGVLPNLVYTPAPAYRGADSFAYAARDGQTSSPPAFVSIQVLDYPNKPTIRNLSGDVADFAPGGPAARLDQGTPAIVTVTGAGNLNSGRLTLMVLDGPNPATDRLDIRDEGSQPGQIGLTGKSVRFGGKPFGAFVFDEKDLSLTVDLTANATAEMVASLLHNIVYSNTAPVGAFAGRRLISAILMDGSRTPSEPVFCAVNIASTSGSQPPASPGFQLSVSRLFVPTNSPPVEVAGFVTNLSAAVKNPQFELETSDESLFAPGKAPKITQEGSLRFEPAAGARGVAAVTVVMVLDGGKLRSAPTGFEIHIGTLAGAHVAQAAVRQSLTAQALGEPPTATIAAHVFGAIRMQLENPSGHACVVEASTDLRNWQILGIFPASELAAAFLDLAPSLMPNRFYRISVAH